MRTACSVGLVFFLAAYTAVAQVAEGRVTADQAATKQGQKDGSENDLLVENVFRYSQTIAVQLSPTDRVELLVRLANAAGKKHPDKARQWAMEALRLTGEMRSTMQRAEYEIAAIRALAAVDSEEALALLPGLEVPASSKDGDPRVKAATSVFQEFLNQHPGDWEKLPPVAQRIGDAGNYPFQAIQIVISRIGSKDQEAAAALTRQAIHYYNLSAHSPSINNRLAILLAEESRFVPGSMLKATLETMLSSLFNKDQGGAAGNDDARLAALNRVTLSLLMPLITSFDPDMEQKLKQEHPALDFVSPFKWVSSPQLVPDLEGAEPIILGPAVLPPGENVSLIFTDTRAQTPASSSDLIERSDQGDAVQIIQTLSPEDVARSLDDSEEALKKEHDPERRLQILVLRGVSLVAGERWAEFSSVLTDAFALGEGLFRNSLNEDPQASWDSRPGARALSTLVEAAAKAAPQIVLERVRNMGTSALQAQLYVSFVEGVQSEQDSPSVVVMRSGD